MSDFILTVKIMVCIFLFVFGFFFGLIIGLTRKVDKAKLEIEAGMQQLLEKQKKTLVYSGANKINIDYRDAQDNQTNRNIVIHYLYDTLSNEEFKSLLSDFDKIKLYGQNIVDKAFSYYKHTKIK